MQIEPMLPLVDCFRGRGATCRTLYCCGSWDRCAEANPAQARRLCGYGCSGCRFLVNTFWFACGNYQVRAASAAYGRGDGDVQTMDIAAYSSAVGASSHLPPVVADPSHGTGRRDMVPAMAKAAVAAGADALLIEIHPNADKAVSDAAQTLYLDQFEKLVGELRVIATAVGRSL